jgi:hypothetical protein
LLAKARGLQEGDVVLVEVATLDATTKRWLPVDASPTMRTLIGMLISTYKLHVVQVAAEGNPQELVEGNPGANEVAVGDTGSIIVGAADVRGRRVGLTNCGTRVDVHSWGDGVVTAGGWNSEKRWRDIQARSETARCYTQSFGGTSAAAAIVAGMAAQLAGIARAKKVGLPPFELRLAIRHGESWNTGPCEIGNAANLEKALRHLGWSC